MITIININRKNGNSNSNFDVHMPIINYYRNVLNIDCLSTLKEQFICYICYHLLRIGYPIKRNGQFIYSFNNDHINMWCFELNQIIIFDDEKDRLKVMSLIKPDDIDLYFKDIYLEHYKLIKLDNITYINIDCNGVIMKLDKKMLMEYSRFYKNTYDDYKYDNLKININVDNITANCIEDFINNENIDAILNAKDILAYHAIVDYLDIHLKKMIFINFVSNIDCNGVIMKLGFYKKNIG